MPPGSLGPHSGSAVDLADEADHAERWEIEEERLAEKVKDLALN